MKTPLEYGERLNVRVEYDSREYDSRRFFNPERRTLAVQDEATARLERDLHDCRKCPMCKMETRFNEDKAMLKEYVEVYAVCNVATSSPCPMKVEGSGYLSTPPSPDWILDAERDAEAVRGLITPRGHGKSTVREMADRISSLTGDVRLSADAIKSHSWGDFAEHKEYAVGDMVNKDGKIYTCTDTKRTLAEVGDVPTHFTDGVITGTRADRIFVDDITEPNIAIEDDDLDEAVEFETNHSNYDNFGSW